MSENLQEFEQGRDAFWNAAQEMTAEQGDLATGKTGVEASQGYVEMQSAIPVPKEPQGLDITDDREGFLRNAADELNKGRDQQQIEREGRAVDTVRQYTEADTGKPKPENETLSIEQASWDLTGVREREKAAADQTDQAEIARLIDELRNGTPEQLQTQPQVIEPASTIQEQPQAPVDDNWQEMLRDPRVLKAGPIEPFKFNAAQKKLHLLLEEQKAKTGRVRAIILKARQLGISSYTAARFYHRTIHSPGLRTIILGHERRASSNLFQIVKRFHDLAPDEIWPSVGTSNAEELIFDRIGNGRGHRPIGNSSIAARIRGRFLGRSANPDGGANADSAGSARHRDNSRNYGKRLQRSAQLVAQG
jgi:hypothetical protein